MYYNLNWMFLSITNIFDPKILIKFFSHIQGISVRVKVSENPKVYVSLVTTAMAVQKYQILRMLNAQGDIIVLKVATHRRHVPEDPFPMQTETRT